MLKIPKSIIINSDSIYDIEYLIYPLVNNEVKFEVNFCISGTYINNNLNLVTQNNTELDTETIYATIQGEFSNNKKYECAYLLPDQTWSTNGCIIFDLINKKITMALSHQSTFKVYEISSSYSGVIGIGPIITTCVLLIITILLIIAFYIIDKNINDEAEHKNKYIVYPIANLFIRQSNGKRISSVMYLFFTYIVMLCLIGLISQIFKSPIDDNYSKYKIFTISDIYSGVIGWILTQLFSIPIYFFLFNDKVSLKCIKIVRIIAIIISFLCVISIIIMTVFYCRQFTFCWIINFFIFMPLQLLLETIFAYFMWKIRKSQIPESPLKVKPEAENLNTPIEDDGKFLVEEKSYPRPVEKSISFDSGTADFTSLNQISHLIASNKVQSFNSNDNEVQLYEQNSYSIENNKKVNDEYDDIEFIQLN
ncbi:hypothetical protein SteCoe_31168 [Stentor coeruleus]|uniref:Uncharacterized protein n=1 Tax=Stentor coeruleus TaxID=5963 RepID=A0A1R2B1V9_9CILI|nr:hypothetical protein SteCoe_31168 [Stentor coeruleus]